MITLPTAAELKVRYPEFTGVADLLVTAVIAEAAIMVDDLWEVADHKPAIMALAAHYLTTEGYPARLTNPTYDATLAGRGIKSRTVGDVSVTFAEAGSLSNTAFLNDLSATVYGRRFVQFMRLNVPAIALV